jgi:hypothetical protein
VLGTQKTSGKKEWAGACLSAHAFWLNLNVNRFTYTHMHEIQSTSKTHVQAQTHTHTHTNTHVNTCMPVNLFFMLLPLATSLASSKRTCTHMHYMTIYTFDCSFRARTTGITVFIQKNIPITGITQIHETKFGWFTLCFTVLRERG